MKISTQKAVVLLFLGALLTWFGYQTFFAAPQKNDATAAFFTIGVNEPASVTAQKLKDQGFIRSHLAFSLMLRTRGASDSLTAGRYQLSRSMTLQGLTNAIIHPTQQEIAITIPEGFSIAEIDKRLLKIGLTNIPGEFAQKALGMEGSLFPDTYFVSSPNFKPEQLITKMKDNFARKLTPDLVTEANRRKRTLSEVIIMASMLEKEAQKENDLAVIAGILWKRLDAGWPLQVDATLLYGKNTTTITFQILEEDTPYNTRKHKGLPPTPVGNPGLRAIRAAIFPEDSPFWFYLSDHEGAIHYAKTNEEQNENRKKWLGNSAVEK